MLIYIVFTRVPGEGCYRRWFGPRRVPVTSFEHCNELLCWFFYIFFTGSFLLTRFCSDRKTPAALKSYKNIQKFCMCIVHLVGLSMVIRKKNIFASNFSSRWLSHVRSVFTNEEGEKEEKEVGPIQHIWHTRWPCVWCHCYRLLSAKREHSQSGRVFATFKRP